MADRLVTTRVHTLWVWLAFGLALGTACRTDRSGALAPSARNGPSALAVRGTLLLPGGSAIEDAVVVVEGGRIEEAGAVHADASEGLLDLGEVGAAAIPGRMDEIGVDVHAAAARGGLVARRAGGRPRPSPVLRFCDPNGGGFTPTSRSLASVAEQPRRHTASTTTRPAAICRWPAMPRSLGACKGGSWGR
jgi:hypothetical protein